MNKNQLRLEKRTLRRSLSARQQQLAAQKLFFKIVKHRGFKRAQSVAFYLPSDGEISLAPALQFALRANKRCYLPALDDQDQMTFRRYTPDAGLVLNRYGIAQPDGFAREIASEDLDLVFMPLVAFDDRGMRLGMGGGYYDRALAYPRTQRYVGIRPQLIGIAHRCQRVGAIPTDVWDVPLDGIITDQGVFKINQNDRQRSSRRFS